MSSNIFRKQIEAGAKLLDEKRPEWVDLIDLSDLDLGDTCNCVIGQVFFEKTYISALMDLFGEEDELKANDLSHDYGFATRSLQGFSYETLTQEWIEYIEGRLGS